VSEFLQLQSFVLKTATP